MITTILEVLVAVVVLIVIIAAAALHFLRADDSDTFDDLPDEPRPARQQRGDVPLDDAAELAASAAPRGRSRRAAAGADDWAQAERGGRHPDSREPRRDREPALAAVSGRRSADRRSRPGGTPERPAGARPAAAAGRPAAAGRSATSDSWDSLSDVDYWAEVASDRPLTPAAAAPAAAPARQRRGADRTADVTRPTEGRPAPGPDPELTPSRSRPPRAGGTGRPTDRTEQIDVRAVRTPSRPSAQPTADSLAALARLADQTPTAAHRGPHSPAPSARQPSARQPSARQPSAGQPPAPRPQLEVPQRAAERPRRDAPAATGRPAERSGPASPAPRPSQPASARTPRPLDDDPLTSPSFPAINASDSRSYRTRRPTSSQQPGPTSSPAGYSYPALPPAGPDGSTTNPYGNGYPAGPRAHPERATPPRDTAAYDSGFAAGRQAVAGADWYAGSPRYSDAAYPPAGRGADLPDAAYLAGQSGSYQPLGSYQPGQYRQPGDYPQPGGYPRTGHGQAGHSQVPYDQRGYPARDRRASPDSQQGYPGYGGR